MQGYRGLGISILHILINKRCGTSKPMFLLPRRKIESITSKPVLKSVTAVTNPTELFINISESWVEVA